MVNIATGLATLEPELEDVLRVLGAKRWDVLIKVGLPRSMPYFYGSLKVAITLAFVGTTVSEMTASNEGIGYLLISAGSSMQMGLAFSGLVVVGAMAMAMYELFSVIEKRTTAWAHRGSRGIDDGQRTTRPGPAPARAAPRQRGGTRRDGRRPPSVRRAAARRRRRDGADASRPTSTPCNHAEAVLARDAAKRYTGATAVGLHAGHDRRAVRDVRGHAVLGAHRPAWSTA